MRSVVFCLLLSMFPALAHAVIAYQEMRPGIGASAEYLIGERTKPAVLLLHGFLQTRDFATVATLARGLQDAGYTLLTPTLSLNIPNRTQSLACEAVHRHTMEDDIAEIGHWVDWLKAHGHRTVVLVGHSFGSLQLLAYLNDHPDPVVKGYLGASLIDVQIGTTSRRTLMANLENRVQKGQRELVSQRLSFCRNYLSTPDGLLSYARWDQPRTLQALNRSPVRVQLIMGDADTTLGHTWLKALKHVQAPMVVIKGANHFMDGQHEFDLLENTLTFLQSIPPAP